MSIEVVESMMIDRGYHTPVHTHTSSDTLLRVRENAQGKKCYAHWLLENKLGIGTLRGLLTEHQDGHLGCIIVICAEGATSFTEKRIREMGVASSVSVFKTIEMKKNITKHILVPEHKLCTDEEVERLKETHNIKHVADFPVLYDNDPVAKYFNFRPKDVIRITRIHGKQELSYYYRVIVPHE